MWHCERRRTDIVKSLIFIGCLLLVQETYAYRRDSYSNDDSFSYTKHENPGEKKPVLYSVHTGNDDRTDRETKQDDKVSNYDFYEPLNQRNKERTYYVEGDQVVNKDHAEPTDDLQPYLKYKNQRKKWMKDQGSSEEFIDKDGYAYDIKGDMKEQPRYGFDVKEQPRYGKEDGSYETRKSKNLEDDSTWREDDSVYHKDLTKEKYLLNNVNQPSERSPHKHNNYQYKLKTAYPKVYESTYESPADIKYSNPKAWSSLLDSTPLNNYNSKHEYKNSLPKDIKKYERINNKELGEIQSEYKHPKSEYHHEKPLKQEYITKENYYNKPESINEDKKEYNHGYLNPSKEEKNSPVSGLAHGSFGDEDNFGKYLKSEYLKFRPFTISNFNHGGHFYGWSYKPYEFMHQKYQADLERKKKILQEHEKKLIEFQKKHMESYEKFMSKEFLGAKHKYPDFRISAMDEIPKKPNLEVDSQEYHNNDPLKRDAVPDIHHYRQS